MSLLDFTLPGSDPNAPNTFVRTPEQVARMQALAAELAKNGADYSPVRSPWQGAARLAQALSGAIGNYQADQAQRLGTANAAASFGNAIGADPSEANIPATPGQTTPALQESDQRNDAITDAGDGADPRAALAAALAGSGGGSLAPVPAVTRSPIPPPTTGGPLAMAAALGAGTPYGTSNTPFKALGYAPSGGAGTPGGYDYAMPTNGANASGLNPAFADRAQDLQQDAADAGIPSTLISGSRSNDLQAKLFANYQARKSGLPLPFPQEGTGGMAAPPGGSYHNFGNAADIVTNNPAQQSALTALSREPWRGITPGANFGDSDHYQIAGPINTGAGASPSAFGAIEAATHSAPVAPPNAPAYAPATTSPAAGASPGGPQGAGVPLPAPAPSQAPQMAQGGAFHPDVQKLLNVLSDPWATPAQQQIATSLLQQQMPTPPTFEKIKDALGNEVPYWANPRARTLDAALPEGAGGSMSIGGPLPATGASPNGTVAPAAGGAASAVAAPAPASFAAQPGTVATALSAAEPNGLTPQGASYLDQLEARGGVAATVARQARSIIYGGEPMPEGKPGEGGLGAMVKDTVLRTAPRFNEALATSRADMVKQYADANGPTTVGGILAAGNKGIHHAGLMADAQANLNNGEWKIVNGTKQFAKEWGPGGNPALEAFELNRHALSDELAKLYKGGVPAAGEIKGMLDTLSPSATPEEQRAVIQKAANLLQGVMTTYQSKWKQAFGARSEYPIIQDENKGVLEKILGGDSAPSAPSAPAAVPALGVGETHSIGGVTIKRIN